MVPRSQQSALEKAAIGLLPVRDKVVPVVSKSLSNYMDNGLKCNGYLIGPGNAF